MNRSVGHDRIPTGLVRNARWGARMHITLTSNPLRANEFIGPPRGRNHIGWHLILLRVRRQPLGWIATVHGSRGDTVGARCTDVVGTLTRQVFGVRFGIFFLNDHDTLFRVRLHNVLDTPDFVRLTLLPIPKFLAAIGVYLHNSAAFWDEFRSVSGSRPARIRRGLSAASLRGPDFKNDYTQWTRYFDTWDERVLRVIADGLSARPSVGVLVFSETGTGAALAATLASVRAQIYAVASLSTATPGQAGAVYSAADIEYIAILQAGEVLPRHALLLLVGELARQETDALLADEDNIGPDGARANPWFKPQPSLTMMCSGLLSRGVWLVRSSVLAQALALADVPEWAECSRLAEWFSLYSAGGAHSVRRVPRVLTHRRPDAEVAPPAMLAQVTNALLGRLGVQATVTADFPLRLRWKQCELTTRKVSLIVPSTLRGETQLRCLLDVLAHTTYRNFEMLIVVTQDVPLDKAQRQAAECLRDAGPVRVEMLRRARFNYSLANNFAASKTDSPFICLLNDDVSTLDGDWLDRMVAVFSDKNVGIVGAKLYYPNMTTQHGGVIMGLGGLACHINRFLPRGEPGYMWRGAVDQELSVVTGACLLVRRDVFEQVGGLDEALPTAFNDVDFCLRARDLKYSVVMAASVELIHHETLSFGNHYADIPDQEAADVALMRERWRAVCAADPFHNPNLSLVESDEWTLAVPPRV